jgi:RNA polymerase sigma-70 factor (ECF subfamily)
MDDDAPLGTLLAAVAQGEHAALRSIYDREGSRLFGIAMAILRDRAAAADAVQETFLRLWQRAGQYDTTRGDARAWIGAVVRHSALDAARARGREQVTDDPTLGDRTIAPDALDRLADAADGARLRECLNGLDDRHRSFIVLAFVHGLSHSQVAARLAMPLGTVKTWIRRGLQQLRDCMS